MVLTIYKLKISGTVFLDVNRLTDFTVNGTGTNADGLFVNMVNPVTHIVIASTTVNADGTYGFGTPDGVSENTSYEMIITRTSNSAGASLTTATIPANWISTGEHVGAGAGDDGAINSRLTVTTTLTGVEQANFGVVKPPDISPNITVVPNVMSGISNFNVTVRITELNLINTNGTITVIIPKDSRWALSGPFDQSLTSLGFSQLNNSVWNYSSSDLYHIFTTTSSITPGSFTTFGFRATFYPANTNGVFNITSQIMSGSGGEVRSNNNVDAEKLDYFNN